ncbi:MAG: pyrroline-5-carboxylate reductase [Clostridia bacterium]|nr:pyrroline-5-carboxylate reductase [Clostridia bacterium]
MAQYEFGFIGTGHMGGALAKAAAKSIDPKRIILANRTPEKAARLAKELHCDCGGNEEAAAARFVVLGVKPQMMADMLRGIAPVLAARRDRFILVSMAAGLTMARISEMAGGDYPVIRITPNTPVEIGKGVILMDANDKVTDGEKDDFLRALDTAGKFDLVEERLFDAGGAVAGCGPAFAYMFIEALADGGVACGLPRAKALSYAADMLAGAAALAASGEKHPGTLKDDVCSPGGSTIVGVRTLEERAFRGAVMDAVIASFEKTRALGK